MRGVRLVACVAVTLAALPAAHAGGPDIDVASYRQAAANGVGAVTGRVYETGVKSDIADRPLPGVVITLLPRSESFRATLEGIKGGARDSIAAYREAALAVRRARQAYERELWVEGALDLVRSTDVRADGAFTVDGVPPGRWVLVAVGSVFVDKPSRRPTKREAHTYAPRPMIVGHSTVHFWLIELEIEPGRVETVELTDRNTWLTGIIEERELDPR